MKLEVSILIHQFNINRLHILTSTNWSGDIFRKFSISINFFFAVAFASWLKCPVFLTIADDILLQCNTIYIYIENASWKVLAYGIYARVVDVSEIERMRAANE